MRNTMITAHSGCEGTPDNSMESIRKGIELGADCIEIDIRKDPQGILRLTHNELEDYSSAIPLDTALRTIAESCVSVNCDLKTDGLLLPVLEAAESCGIPRERLIFSGSVDVDVLEKDPSVVKRCRIFLNIDRLFSRIVNITAVPETWEERGELFRAHIEEASEIVKRLGVECINPCFRMMPPEIIAACNERGIGLSLWTVNEEADQERLLREDLVNITTRKPAGALRLRKEIRGY